MTTYILILFVTIGAISDKDSMALATVPGFSTRGECAVAGGDAVEQFGTGTKRAAFVCVAQKK